MTDTEIRLGDARESLLEERDTIIDEVAGLEPSNPAYADKVDRGAEIDTHLDGVEYCIDEYGADATVAVRGLTAGTFARLEDDLHAATDGVAGPGAARNYTVAYGVVEAPFYPEGADDVDTRLAAIASLPVPVVKWLQTLVDEETGVGGNGRQRFGELLQARRGSETPTATSSSTTPSDSP